MRHESLLSWGAVAWLVEERVFTVVALNQLSSLVGETLIEQYDYQNQLFFPAAICGR